MKRDNFGLSKSETQQMEQNHQKCTKDPANAANQYDQPAIADTETCKGIG